MKKISLMSFQLFLLRNLFYAGVTKDSVPSADCVSAGGQWSPVITFPRIVSPTPYVANNELRQKVRKFISKLKLKVQQTIERINYAKYLLCM